MATKSSCCQRWDGISMHPNPSLIQENGILLDQLHQSTSLWKGEHIVSHKTSLGKGQAINQNCCCCSGEADVICVKFVWTNWLYKKYDFQDWLYAPLALRRKVSMVRGVWESLRTKVGWLLWLRQVASNDSPPNYPPLHPLLLHCYPLVLILLLPIIICHRAKFFSNSCIVKDCGKPWSNCCTKPEYMEWAFMNIMLSTT